MKRFLAFFLVMIFAAISFAADTTNVAVSIKETDTHLIYYGVAYMKSDAGEDNCFTQAFDISQCTDALGHAVMVCTNISGTEDINVYTAYSYEFTDNTPSRAKFYTHGTQVIDQLQITVKYDTIGVVNAAYDGFKGAKWMMFKFDGQTSSPHSTPINWWLTLRKNSGAAKRGCGQVVSTTS